MKKTYEEGVQDERSDRSICSEWKSCWIPKEPMDVVIGQNCHEGVENCTKQVKYKGKYQADNNNNFT